MTIEDLVYDVCESLQKTIREGIAAWNDLIA